MFKTISDLIPRDKDYPPRARRLDILQRVLDGKLYDVLPFEFHDERTSGGEYIPLRQRRPSVRYSLPRIVVEDSVALLFSDGHFPAIESPNREVREALTSAARSIRLNSVMTEAAIHGSIGSVAVLLKVLRGRPFLEVMSTLYLTPLWERDCPDRLLEVTERYKVPGTLLVEQGYQISDTDCTYWFMRRWDQHSEIWFQPIPVGGSAAATIDESRTVRHGFGFVPIVWIKNLPGGQGVDGACTFESAIHTSIEIDYQLSQAGRGLKYSSDPTLLIREPVGLDSNSVRGAANALVVSEKGDAKLLEIGGTASQAVIEYVRVLRELALENIHGNRSDPSKLTVPASGRALELMNQGLLWLADNLRVSYGQSGVIEILKLVLRANKTLGLSFDGERIGELDVDAPICLRWPNWYPPDALDRQREVDTVNTMVTGKLLSREAGLRLLANAYGVNDIKAEMNRISVENQNAR